MTKQFITVSILIFVAVCIADPSWAMGKRGGSSGNNTFAQSQSGNQGSNQNTPGNNGIIDDSQVSDGANEGDNDETGPEGSQPESFYNEISENEEFPASTTVPEPTTMSLMGMGLASFLLKRRKKS